MNAPVRPIHARHEPHVQYTDDFYVYPVNFGNLAQSATVNVNLQIQADSNFEWIMSTVTGWLAIGAGTAYSSTIILPLQINIVDGGSGRSLIDTTVAGLAGIPGGGAFISAIAGDGKQPFILPVTKTFMARSTIQFTLKNVDSVANTYNSVTLHLIGRKIFELGGLPRR